MLSCYTTSSTSWVQNPIHSPLYYILHTYLSLSLCFDLSPFLSQSLFSHHTLSFLWFDLSPSLFLTLCFLITHFVFWCSVFTSDFWILDFLFFCYATSLWWHINNSKKQCSHYTNSPCFLITIFIYSGNLWVALEWKNLRECKLLLVTCNEWDSISSQSNLLEAHVLMLKERCDHMCVVWQNQEVTHSSRNHEKWWFYNVINVHKSYPWKSMLWNPLIYNIRSALQTQSMPSNQIIT